jgi:hypothetical protein
MEIVQALYDQNKSVGLRDVHLPGGWHLNARRVPVPPVPLRRLARRDEIRHQRAILPSDLHEDPAFTMDSAWWDHPAYKPCPRRWSGLLGMPSTTMPQICTRNSRCRTRCRRHRRKRRRSWRRRCSRWSSTSRRTYRGGGPPIEESELIELGN